MYFLIPRNITRERSIALLGTIIRRWEGLRQGEVKEWQERYLVKWDATSGRNGSVARAACDALLEMERFGYETGATQQGLDLAMAFAKVSVPVVWSWAVHLHVPKRILRMLCGYFLHQRGVQFEGCFAKPPGHLAGINVELCHKMQDALSEVLRVFCADDGRGFSWMTSP